MACRGLGTAPPNDPECRSTAGPRRVISAPASPRIEVTALGRSGAAMPVSLTTTTSQSSRSRCSRSRAAKWGDPDSSSPSTSSLTVTAGVSRPVAARWARMPSRCMATLPLSSIAPRACSSGPSGPSTTRRLERRVHPQLQRVDRLHVVVPVDERDRGLGVAATATRRRRRARPASARSRPSGSRRGAAPRPATRRCAATSEACAGRRRSTGCAARRRGRRAGRRGARSRTRVLGAGHAGRR